MLEMFVASAWVCAAAYGFWYVFRAKEYVPLSQEEVFILWNVHKKDTKCNSEKLHQIKRKNAIVGFECDCGYKYYSRRRITQKPVNHFEHGHELEELTCQ
ncbi:hypothetical protein GWO13_02250 [Candidatus Bathyarchaeota archaeon]|nr:hypothetical protein [Candidatus Bathyarchaeota archaeon]